MPCHMSPDGWPSHKLDSLSLIGVRHEYIHLKQKTLELNGLFAYGFMCHFQKIEKLSPFGQVRLTVSYILLYM